MQSDFLVLSSEFGPPVMGGGSVKNVPATILDNKIFPKTQKPRHYDVVILNDDYTPMDYVESLLRRHFGQNASDARSITRCVHTRGRGIAGTYQLDVAATKASEAQADAKAHGHPLRLDTQPHP